MDLVVITRPTLLPVSVEQAKDHLRVNGHHDDVYIATLIRAAVLEVENVTGYKLMNQTLELQLDGFPACNVLDLRCGHVTAVSSIKYDDTDDAEQTYSASNYWADIPSNGRAGRVVKKPGSSWPVTKSGKPASVRVRMTAGWTDYRQVPDHFLVAIKLLIGHWYENREEVVVGTSSSQLPVGVDRVLNNPEYMLYRL